MSRGLDAWNERVALAEGLKAKVITELKIGAVVPDRPSAAWPRSPPAARSRRTARRREGRRRDRQSRLGRPRRRVQGHVRRRGAEGAGHLGLQRLPHPPRLEHGLPGPAGGRPAAAVTPDEAVPVLNKALGFKAKPFTKATLPKRDSPTSPPARGPERSRRGLQVRLRRPRRDAGAYPLSWDGATWPFQHPLDYVGSEGGGGVGGGPGTVGTALALKGSGRMRDRRVRRRRLHDGATPRSGPRRMTRSQC